jgi:hypothetical protein
MGTGSEFVSNSVPVTDLARKEKMETRVSQRETRPGSMGNSRPVGEIAMARTRPAAARMFETGIE